MPRAVLGRSFRVELEHLLTSISVLWRLQGVGMEVGERLEQFKS